MLKKNPCFKSNPGKAVFVGMTAGFFLWTFNFVHAQSNGIIGFNDDGWNSDDTRDNAGTNIVNDTTQDPAQGATSDATQVATQLDWQNYLFSRGNLGALRMSPDGAAAGKASISQVNTTGNGFGSVSNILTPSFSAEWSWSQQGSVNEGASFKMGIQSADWGTGVGQSQQGFTSERSGEGVWDLVIVAGAGGPGVEFETADYSTRNFQIFAQAGNTFFTDNTLRPNGGGRIASGTLEEIMTGNATMNAAADITASELATLVSGGIVTSTQVGVGSGTDNGLPALDWLSVSYLNSGERIDFIDAARYNGTNSDYGSSANWDALPADPGDPVIPTAPSPNQNFIIDTAGNTDLTVNTSATSRSLGVLNGTTNLTINEDQTLTLASSENGTLFVEAGASANVQSGPVTTGSAGVVDAGVLESAGALNIATVANLSGGDDPHPQRDGSGSSRYAIVVHSGGDMTLEDGANVTVSQTNLNVGVRVGGDGDPADGVATLTIQNGATLDIDSTTTSAPNGFFTVGAWGREGVVTQTGGTVNLTQTNGHAGSFNVGNQGGTGTYHLSGGTLNLGGGNHSLGRVASGSVNTPGSGTVNISGTGTLNLNDNGFFVIGDRDFESVHGDGFINQTGGTFSVANSAELYLGGYGNSIYNLDGGTLEIGGNSLRELYVDGSNPNNSGSYAFNLGGGTLRVIDSDLTTTATPTLVAATNSTFDTNGFNAVFQNGLTGTGSFTKIGDGNMELGGITTLSGTSTIAGDDNLVIGSAAAGEGTLNLDTGAALNVDDSTGSGFSRVIVGNGGTGTMNIDGGSVDLKFYADNGATFRVGAQGGEGTVNMSDGSVTVTEGSAGIYGVLVIGQDADSVGIFEQTGGSIDMNGVGVLQVGIADGTGTLSMFNNASFTMNGAGSTIYIGHGASGDGTVNFDDNATFSQTANVQNFIGSSGGTGTFNQNGAGTNVTWEGDHGTDADRPFWLGYSGTGGSGTYNLSAGNLTFNDMSVSFGRDAGNEGTLNQSGGVLVADGSNATASAVVIGHQGTGNYHTI